jgi:hypothetical protein
MPTDCSAGFSPFPTVGTLVKASTNQFVRWLCYDAEGNVSLNIGSGTINGIPPGGGGGSGPASSLLFGTMGIPIGTTPPSVAGQILTFDGTNIIASTPAPFPLTVVAKGQTALGTAVVPALATRSVTLTSGLLTTDTIVWNLNGNISGTAAYMSGQIVLYVAILGTGVAQAALTNPSSSPVTPGAINLNWMVLR